MPTMWNPDTCDCKVVLNDSGKAIAFKKQCDLHKNKKPEDVVEDNRNKNKGLNIVARELGIDHSKISFERGDNNEFVFSAEAPEGKKTSLNKLLAAQKLTSKIK